MCFVIDTNQADEFRHHAAPAGLRPTLVIPPLMWAEILLGPKHADQCKALANYDLRFGMDPPTIFAGLSRLTEDEIRSFDPVFPVDSDIHARQLRSFLNPSEKHFQRARQFKQWATDHTDRVIAGLAFIRKKTRDNLATAKSRGETVELIQWSTITEAEDLLFFREDSPYRRWLVEQVTEDEDGGNRMIRATSKDELFDAAWANHAIRRFLRLRATVAHGYAQCWNDNTLNVPPASNRNDEPDMMLPLYARDGDVILIRDNKMKRAIRHADPEKLIEITTWPAWLSTNQ